KQRIDADKLGSFSTGCHFTEALWQTFRVSSESHCYFSSSKPSLHIFVATQFSQEIQAMSPIKRTLIGAGVGISIFILAYLSEGARFDLDGWAAIVIFGNG
ncbi:MAG: hypothetical protein R6U63_05830, partial [Longimicrobiales bacterium]